MVAPRPVVAQGVSRMANTTHDPIIAFLQQNPTIVMKPPSPAPGPMTSLPGMLTGCPVSAHGPLSSPLLSGLPPPSIRVTTQQGSAPPSARVPSPISEFDLRMIFFQAS